MRKKIMKLAKRCADSTTLLAKIDVNSPEYYVLDCLVDEEMEDVALAMALRKPRNVKQLSQICGKSEEETERLAFKLAQVGACHLRERDGVDTYELAIFAPGILEKAVSNKEMCEKYPIIAKAFDEYTLLRGGMLASLLPMGYGPMRVIPIASSIDGDTRSCTYEEVASILDMNTKFAVADCSCRRSRRLMGEGCGHLEHDICIHVGHGAEYYVRVGNAREITKEEALAVIKKAEENGLMHNVPNVDGPEKVQAICNCCACSCFAIRNAAYKRSPDMIRSNYVAEADRDKCVACGQCVENCPMNALKLGQKLCAKTPIIHKDAASPRNHTWGKENWNPDYRINREDVMPEGTAPCKTECPAHIAVQGYIKLAAQGKYKDALALIKKENPFPAVCGRICPRKCESACTRGDVDDPVAIDEIKKFIADQELNEAHRFVPAKRYHYGKQIAVIGAGPAGLSCAYFLAVDGYRVTVFEKEQKLGGMLTLGIPSFRLEKDVVYAEIEILKELGVQFKTGVEVGKDITLNELRNQGYEAFYLAIGAQGGRSLGIEGEDATGVISGVDFLRSVSLEKPIPIQGNVIVIGGGNVAIDVARTAVRENVNAVHMYCLEKREEMPALKEEIEEALHENIQIENSWGPSRIVTEDGKVVGVEFKKCLSVLDGQKRFNPTFDETETRFVGADTVLLSIGQTIQWHNLLDGENVSLNPNQTVKADAFTYATEAKDIFVGGDAYTGPKFAIDAIAAGKQGAISIHRAVWEGQSLILGRDRRDYHAIDKDNVIFEGFDQTPRQRPQHKPVAAHSFGDARMTFTEAQMLKESERCLGCGAVVVDQEMCVGCGQCTTKCKFDAIKMVRKFDSAGGTWEDIPKKMVMHNLKRGVSIPITAIKEAIGPRP